MKNVKRNSGFSFMIRNAGHSTFSTTHPGMYEYLPADEGPLKETWMLQSGAYAAARTRELFENVFFWAYLCALTEECMHPPGSIRQPCDFGHNSRIGKNARYAGCHRFDQSVLNILLGNLYGNAIQKLHKDISIASERRRNINRFQGYHGYTTMVNNGSK